MTYREKIFQLINAINEVYDDAEFMRSLATPAEKEYWNRLRLLLFTAPDILKALDNMLPFKRSIIQLQYMGEDHFKIYLENRRHFRVLQEPVKTND